MPRVAPVTIATRPAKSFFSSANPRFTSTQSSTIQFDALIPTHYNRAWILGGSNARLLVMQFHASSSEFSL
jgi:hypothetical protein